DAAGAPLGRFGRRGGGPGEFSSVYSMGWKADSMWIYDQSARRVTLLTPERALARTERLPDQVRLPVGDGTETVVHTRVEMRGFARDGAMLLAATPRHDDLPEPYRHAWLTVRLDAEGTLGRVVAITPTGDGHLETPPNVGGL